MVKLAKRHTSLEEDRSAWAITGLGLLLTRDFIFFAEAITDIGTVTKTGSKNYHLLIF